MEISDLKNKPIEPTLKNMEIGTAELFLLEKTKSVRATVSIISTVTGMKFKTRQINEDQVIEVKRIS
jgi:hypothetical protein